MANGCFTKIVLWIFFAAIIFSVNRCALDSGFELGSNYALNNPECFQLFTNVVPGNVHTEWRLKDEFHK